MGGALEEEQRRGSENTKIARKLERKYKEVTYAVAEDKKNLQKLQDLSEKLNSKANLTRRHLKKLLKMPMLPCPNSESSNTNSMKPMKECPSQIFFPGGPGAPFFSPGGPGGPGPVF